MRALMLAACAFLGCGALVAQEEKPGVPKKNEVYETVEVWVAEVVTSLNGGNRQLGVFHSKAEADAAAQKWDDANDAKGKDKSLATTNVREATVRVPIRKYSGSDKTTPSGKLEILPPRPFVDPGSVKKVQKPIPELKGKKLPGQIDDINVTFEFGEGGKLEITGDATGSGKWEQDGASIKMETKVATYRGRVSEAGLAGLRFWKDNSKPLAQWNIDLQAKPKQDLQALEYYTYTGDLQGNQNKKLTFKTFAEARKEAIRFSTEQAKMFPGGTSSVGIFTNDPKFMREPTYGRMHQVLVNKYGKLVEDEPSKTD